MSGKSQRPSDKTIKTLPRCHEYLERQGYAMDMRLTASPLHLAVTGDYQAIILDPCCRGSTAQQLRAPAWRREKSTPI